MDTAVAYAIMRISVFSSLLPFGVAVSQGRKFDATQRALRTLVVMALLIELSAFALNRFLQLTNLPLLHVYTVVEFALMLFVFQRLGVIGRRAGVVLVALFTLLAGFAAVYWHSVYEMNVVPRSVESVVVSVLALRYFFQRFYAADLHLQAPSLGRSPGFWFATGLLLYFPASLFVFLYGAWFIEMAPLSWAIYAGHALLNITKNILFSIALWVKPQTQVLMTSSP